MNRMIVGCGIGCAIAGLAWASGQISSAMQAEVVQPLAAQTAAPLELGAEAVARHVVFEDVKNLAGPNGYTGSADRLRLAPKAMSASGIGASQPATRAGAVAAFKSARLVKNSLVFGTSPATLARVNSALSNVVAASVKTNFQVNDAGISALSVKSASVVGARATVEMDVTTWSSYTEQLDGVWKTFVPSAPQKYTVSLRQNGDDWVLDNMTWRFANGSGP